MRPRPATDVFTRLVAAAVRRPARTAAAWLVLAVTLTVALPSLEQVAAHQSAAFLPPSSPTLHGLRVMDRAFGSGRAQSFVFIVLEDTHGLSAADDATYRALVARLRADPQVVELQDYVSQPRLRSVFTSHDRQATYLPLALPDAVGSPAAIRDVQHIDSIVTATPTARGTRTYVTGDPAMVADLNDAVSHASLRVTIISVTLLIIILLVIYRRLLTPLVPLVTIGAALLTTRGLVSLLAQHGMAVSSYTGAFLSAIVLGAGTDYSVFLISRFQEQLREGSTVTDAVHVAGARIGRVLAASAGTVVLGSLCMAATKLSLFAATGPALAVAVAVTAVTALTLTPALLRVGGHRFASRSPATGQGGWWRIGHLVASRPARVLLAGSLVLLAMAMVFPTVRFSFDERAAQPANTPSNIGDHALARHFPANETLPDYLLVVSDHDMSDPADLAALNSLTRALTKVPGVVAVRSITEPTGTLLPQATLAGQAGLIGDQLAAADQKLRKGQPGIQRLAHGAHQLADGSHLIGTGAAKASDAVSLFIRGLDALAGGLGTAATGTGSANTGAHGLSVGAKALADGLQTAHDQTGKAVDGLHLIVVELNADPVCTTDPICSRARTGLAQIYQAEHDQLLPGLQRAADGARRIASGDGQLASGLRQLHAGLLQAQNGSRRLAAGERVFGQRLGQLAGGAQQLATGAGLLPAGIDRLTAATGKLTNGLHTAANYLRQVHSQAGNPDASGFYLPTAALDNAKFALARQLFLSRDGRVTRIQITGATDPLSSSGLHRAAEIQRAADLAVRGTPLAHATLLATGASGLGTDLRNYLAADARFVVIAVLASVLLILIVTLRALIAPLYLLASVILSYAAAMGLTTLVWQHLLGHPIDFTVPVLDFVILVAVGADYNIFLMSRLREEAEHVNPASITRAVAATGGVITSAGIIFASTFAALTSSPVIGLAENGFAVATGLLLDTFVVRSMLVPSTAALLRDFNWWPRKPATETNTT